MKRSCRSINPPHVAICVDKTRTYGRGLLQGIADYVESHQPWSIYLEPHADGTLAPEWLREWRGDGILAFVGDRRLAQRLARSLIPTVDIYGHTADLNLPHVGNDDVRIGSMAAEHLLELRFQSFGFCGFIDQDWVERRYQGFKATIKKADYSCRRFHQPMELFPTKWEQSQKALAQWVEQIRKPAGIMACNDPLAQRVLDACNRTQVAVPDEVAVIGVDNDEELCRLANPPLSSVVNNPRRIGYEAATLLERLMARKVRPKNIETILIPPHEVISRRSTNVKAIEDKLIAKAVQFIDDHACEGITVEDVLSDLHISRSVFYRRFEKHMDRSPHEEIIMKRVNRVKALLTQTSLQLPKIAELAGFSDGAYMNVVFQKVLGITPGRYRKKNTLLNRIQFAQKTR